MDWSRGALTDEQAIARLAAPIPDFPYTRQEPLTDHNGDGVLTQRDAYVRDYQLLMQRPSGREAAQTPGFDHAKERGQSVPSSSDHPDHNLYSQIAGHVLEQDRLHGRTWDETSERMTASLLTLAKDNGLTQVDHMVFSVQAERVAAGENVFVVQGRL